MTSETSGILRWTSSIKDSMINDPGRQFFEDQVQSQGFLFLEEYLDNIWAATKPDSFVDLVKTPGKRRVSPQKARPAVITHTTSLALSDEKDVFQSNPLKLSPSPITSIVESTDQAVDSSPQIPRTRSAIVDKTEVATQPLPSAPPAPSTFVDMSVPLKEEDASANGISRNPSLPQFPSLAAPSPLRKSTRNHRESSFEPNLATTPGTGLTANHSSWLAKVREAKAIEVTNKRASVALVGLPAPSGGVKRRSGELPDSLSYNGDDNEERKAKIPKTSAGSAGTLHLDPRPSVAPALHISPPDVRAAKPADEAGSDVDMIAPLKKAIEVLRARTGKSLAGTLVEASAQEPTPVVRETNVSDVSTGALSQPNALWPSLSAPVPIREAVATSAIVRTTPPKSTQLITQPTLASPPHEGGRRLSISDLVPKHDKRNATQSTSTSETSISTTPPDSPPAAKKTAFFVPGGPVFNKFPPVFVPPPARKPEPLSADSNTDVIKGQVSEPTSYSFAAPFGLGLQPTKLPRSPPRVPISGPSTQSSSFSDNVFESQNDVPSWVPRSQETEITSQEQESRAVLEKEHATDLDDDDSWRIDDKFAATNQMWTPFAGITTVEDSMTWSTVPSQSQIGGRSPQQDPTEDSAGAAVRSQRSHDVIDELDENMVVDVDEDVKRDMLNETKPMVAVNYDATKSQLSVASSSGESSHPVGFFGHATKLVSSMLGVSKKNKTEPPKSIQLAATAAKKEEQDRRAVRLKEMEARRQAVLQKKAEEEKVKADEEEKKAKEDSERRKREREENTGKRPLVKADSKPTEEDNTRKRKITVEPPKVNPPSKEKKEAPPTRITKPGQGSSVKVVTIAKQPSTASLNQTTSGKAAPVPAPAPVSAKGKTKAQAHREDTQPKKAVQSQSQMAMEADGQAQRRDGEPLIASEMIELPEPNSEYSDSEDEDRQRKFDAPEWTQSPELRAALESQSRVNPDDIFGPVRPLRMEDIFRTRTSRFRARTSSANWSGPDGLRQEEEREYARRMGFR